MSGAPQDVPLLSTLRYEELSVGRRWGPFRESIDAATADRVRGPIGTLRPGPRAPLGVLPLLTLRVMRRALEGIPPGGILARLRFSIFDSLAIDEPIDVGVWLSARQQSSRGLFTTLAFSLAQADIEPAVVEWVVLAPGPAAVEAPAAPAAPGARVPPASPTHPPSSTPPVVPPTAPPRARAEGFPELTHTIGAEAIEQYAELSGDYNPLHVDPEYARRGPFGAIAAHGPIALQTVFEALAGWLGPERGLAGATIDVAFRHPVLIDDAITCRAAGEPLEHAGAVVVPVHCTNQHGAVVLEALLACPRRARTSTASEDARGERDTRGGSREGGG